MVGFLIQQLLVFKHRYRHRENTVKMKAEIRVLLLHTKGHKRFPANYQKLGKRCGTDPFLTVLRRNQFC